MISAVATLAWIAAIAVIAEAVRQAIASLAHFDSFAAGWAIALALVAYTAPIGFAATGSLSASLFTLALVSSVVLWRRRRLGAARRRIALDVREGPSLVIAALVLWILVSSDIWDRHIHTQLVMVAARGVVPIELPAFPGEPFAYHVSFDLLAAALVSFASLEGPLGIELLQLLTIAPLLALLRRQFFEEGAKGGVLNPVRSPGLWAAPLVLQSPIAQCSGATPYLGMCDELLPFADVYSAVPPPVSGVFQVAMCFGWAVMLAALPLFSSRNLGARVALAGIVLTLSEVNVVMFLVGGLAFGATAVLEVLHQSTRRVGALTAALLLLAVAMWLARGSLSVGEGQLRFGGFFGDHAALGLLVFMPAAIIGLAWSVRHLSVQERPADVVAAIIVVVGIIVPLVVSYRFSWDIVKFFHVAAFFGAILFAKRLS